MFRRATMQRTWPKGQHEWSGTTETFHWLEVEPDLWIGTNRICESEVEAKDMQEYCGYGERKTKTRSMLAHTRYLRQTADSETLEIFDPA